MLRAVDLVHSYRGRSPRLSVDHVSLTVRPEARTMLLGPNGAGKSTLLKLLAGADTPRSGRVEFGGETDRRALMRHVGWMPQDVRPLARFTVLEQVEYAAWLAGRSAKESRSRARTAVEQVDLGAKRSARVGELSGGQLRRVGLAQAVAQGGGALLLDEPLAGLDPEQMMIFRDLLTHVECPAGVVVSTHQVADLVQVVDAVVVLAHGRVCFDSTLDDFLALGSGESRADRLGSAYATVINAPRPARDPR